MYSAPDSAAAQRSHDAGRTGTDDEYFLHKDSYYLYL